MRKPLHQLVPGTTFVLDGIEGELLKVNACRARIRLVCDDQRRQIKDRRTGETVEFLAPSRKAERDVTPDLVVSVI